MRKCILLISLIVFAGCRNNKSKADHVLTANLCKYEPNKCPCNLYVEVYRVFGMGAFGSDMNSEYLTDSVNFRIYIGTYDDSDENIIAKCKGDSVYTAKTKKTSSIPEWDIPKILETKTYSLRDLKMQQKFE